MTVPAEPRMLGAEIERWRATEDLAPERCFAAFLRAVARRVGVDPALLRALTAPGAEPSPPPGLLACADAGALGAPGAVGPVHQVLRSRQERRRRGAVYTSPEVALALHGLAMAQRPDRGRAVGDGLVVLDPACGGGVFLLAAAARAMADGADPATALSRLWGIDSDPDAVALAHDSLVLWAAGAGVEPATASSIVSARLAVADPLVVPVQGSWFAVPPPSGFDLVIGNPPFLAQLKRTTVRSPDEAAALRQRFGTDIGPYTDTASCFVLVALEAAAPGALVELILPTSFLAARDAGAVRRRALEHSHLVALWDGGPDHFDADVDVVAVTLRRHDERTGIGDRTAAPTRWSGVPPRPSEHPAPTVDLVRSPTWAHLVATRSGVPQLEGWWAHDAPAGTLADLVEGSAGFRDEYYDLAPFVREDLPGHDGARHGPGPDDDRSVRLLTVGLIDPAHIRWGSASTRYVKQAWERPVVDVGRIDPDTRLARWAAARLRPKVVVATQTRVIEAVVDPVGRCWPSTPAIALHRRDGLPAHLAALDADLLWFVAAAVMAPHATAWALTFYGGAGMVRDVVKLASAQLLTLPLPPDLDAWSAGAAAVRAATAASTAGDGAAWRSSIEAMGAAMASAYPEPGRGEVLAWWIDRLPSWRAGRR